MIGKKQRLSQNSFTSAKYANHNSSMQFSNPACSSKHHQNYNPEVKRTTIISSQASHSKLLLIRFLTFKRIFKRVMNYAQSLHKTPELMHIQKFTKVKAEGH